MTQTLRDEMAALMPGMKWTRPMCNVTVAKVGRCPVARVYGSLLGRVTVILAGWQGHCQSPAHAAKTIRRKLRKFIEIFGKALETEASQ